MARHRQRRVGLFTPVAGQASNANAASAGSAYATDRLLSVKVAPLTYD
jgi:hypothetical protein